MAATLDIGANTRSFESEIEAAERALGDLEGRADRVASSGDELNSSVRRVGRVGMAAAAAGAAAAAAAIAGLGVAIVRTTEAARAQERVSANLAGALDTAGQSYDANRERLDQFFASLQRTTRFGDDEAAAAMTAVAQATSALEPSMAQLERYTMLVTDVAQRTGRSMQDAAAIVARAAAGNTEALLEQLPAYREQLIAINELETTAERGAAALDILSANFEGAGTQITGFDLALSRLGNGFSDVVEAAGSLITNNERVVEALSRAANVVDILAARLVGATGASDGTREAFDLLVDSAADFTDWVVEDGVPGAVELIRVFLEIERAGLQAARALEVANPVQRALRQGTLGLTATLEEYEGRLASNAAAQERVSDLLAGYTDVVRLASESQGLFTDSLRDTEERALRLAGRLGELLGNVRSLAQIEGAPDDGDSPAAAAQEEAREMSAADARMKAIARARLDRSQRAREEVAKRIEAIKEQAQVEAEIEAHREQQALAKHEAALEREQERARVAEEMAARQARAEATLRAERARTAAARLSEMAQFENGAEGFVKAVRKIAGEELMAQSIRGLREGFIRLVNPSTSAIGAAMIAASLGGVAAARKLGAGGASGAGRAGSAQPQTIQQANVNVSVVGGGQDDGRRIGREVERGVREGFIKLGDQR